MQSKSKVEIERERERERESEKSDRKIRLLDSRGLDSAAGSCNLVVPLAKSECQLSLTNGHVARLGKWTKT